VQGDGSELSDDSGITKLALLFAEQIEVIPVVRRQLKQQQ